MKILSVCGISWGITALIPQLASLDSWQTFMTTTGPHKYTDAIKAASNALSITISNDLLHTGGEADQFYLIHRNGSSVNHAMPLRVTAHGAYLYMPGPHGDCKEVSVAVDRLQFDNLFRLQFHPNQETRVS